MSEESVGCGGVFFSSHIALQDRDYFYREQWDHHHYNQKNRILTDIIIQVNDGSSVELHQAVLAPHSPLISSLQATLLVLIPDYRKDIVQALADLLYTGRCQLKDPFSDLTEIISLAQNLGLSTLSRDKLSLSLSSYQHKKFGSINGSDTTESDCNEKDQSILSHKQHKPNSSVHLGTVKKIMYRRKQKIGLSCPICCEIVEGGNIKLRCHLVDKHFYKQLSARLGRKARNCPLCDKQVMPRSGLIKHYGIKHGVVDLLLEEMNIDPENNELVNNTIDSQNRSTSKKALVTHDVLSEDCEVLKSRIKYEGRFDCVICPKSRKNRFRLLQHYSLAHFKDRLVEEFNSVFEDFEGKCRMCGKKFTDVVLFSVHIGAGHQKVLKYLEEQAEQHIKIKKEKKSAPVHCYFPTCSESVFPNNSSLMRHLTMKHFRKQLVDVLQPKFDVSNKCEQCGREIALFKNYLIHCAITHRLIIDLYMEFLRVKKETGSSLHLKITNPDEYFSDLEFRDDQ